MEVRVRGGLGYTPETAKQETSDARLGVQAGGWESSFRDAVWVVMGSGGGRWGCGLKICRGRWETNMTFGLQESNWGHWSIGEWI